MDAQQGWRTRAHFQQEGVGAIQVEIGVVSAIPIPQCQGPAVALQGQPCTRREIRPPAATNTQPACHHNPGRATLAGQPLLSLQSPVTLLVGRTAPAEEMRSPRPYRVDWGGMCVVSSKYWSLKSMWWPVVFQMAVPSPARSTSKLKGSLTMFRVYLWGSSFTPVRSASQPHSSQADQLVTL